MQTEEHNFKTLFYQPVPDKVIREAKEAILEMKNESALKNRNTFKYFDDVVLIKWVNTFYSKYKRMGSKFNNYYEHLEHCNSTQAVGIFNDIVNDLKIYEMVDFFPVIMKKRNYTPAHFKNQQYIKMIESEIRNLLIKKKQQNFEFPVSEYLRVDNNYYWTMFDETDELEEFLTDDYKNLSFTFNRRYQLRRRFDISKDDFDFDGTGLEKLVYDIKFRKNTIAFFDKVPLEEWEIIMNFLKQLNVDIFYSIDFKHTVEENYYFVFELCKEINITPPLKFYITNEIDLRTELIEFFKDSKHIEVNYYDRMIFKFEETELIHFLNYMYHDLDQRSLELYQNMDSFYKLSADFIWDNIIQHSMLQQWFEFSYSESNMQYFRKNFITDYMLKEVVYDNGLKNNFKKMKDTIINSFNMYRSFDKTTPKMYYIDIFKYIKDLLKAKDVYYILPRNPWEILNDYFDCYFKVQPEGEYGLFELSYFRDDLCDITDDLIKNLNVHYSKSIISDEMKNCK